MNIDFLLVCIDTNGGNLPIVYATAGSAAVGPLYIPSIGTTGGVVVERNIKRGIT